MTFEEYISQVRNNEPVLKLSTSCLCVYCGSAFPPEKIIGWVQGRQGRTALCPYCSMDSVLENKISEQERKEIASIAFSCS